MSLGTILLIVLVLLLVGALPTWPHSRSWGYGPTGGLGLVLIIVLVLLGRFFESRARGRTSDAVKKLIGLGASVAVETGAGFGAKISDADYAAAGATVAPRAGVMGPATVCTFTSPSRSARSISSSYRPCN